MEPEQIKLYADPKRQILIDAAKRPIKRYEQGRITDIKRDVATIGNGVEVGESGIKEAGYGLFASRVFEKNEIITYYDGAVAPFIEPSEIQPEFKSHARKLNEFYTIFGDYTVDGVKLDLSDPIQRAMLDGTGGASRANAQIGVCAGRNNADWLTVRSETNRKNPFKENPFDIVVLIYAKKRIEPGEEIFISYGDDYWTNRTKGGNKVPHFLTREQYEAAQAEKEKQEVERKKKLKRVAPDILVREDEEQKKTRITEPCFICGKATPLIHLTKLVFVCSEHKPCVK